MTSDPKNDQYGFMQGPGPITDWTPESLQVAWDDFKATYPLSFLDEEDE